MIVRKVSITVATAELIAVTGFGDPVVLQNLGPGSLYIGSDDTVLNTTGFLVTVEPAVNSQVNLLNHSGEIWGYASGGGCDVRVIENVSG